MKNISLKTAVIAMGVLFFSSMAMADSKSQDTFIIYPAHPNATNPETMMYELKPGDQTSDEINVKNFSSEKKDLTFYVTDEFTAKNGLAAYRNPGDNITMSKLTKLSTPSITLNPGETKTINVSINIPKNQPLGDYLGGIAAVNTFPSANMPSIKIAVRYIRNLDIKVTNTPKHIPLYGETNIFGAQLYLPFSIALFLGCMGYVFWAKKTEKKNENLVPEDGQKDQNDV